MTSWWKYVDWFRWEGNHSKSSNAGHIGRAYNSLWKKEQNKQISYFGMMSANKILQQKNTTNLEKIVQIAACNMMKTASIWKGNGWQELT